jgi:hypothetical protein
MHDQDTSWLAQFDSDFRPEQPIRPGLETLSDNQDYDCQITDARLDATRTGQRLLRVGLRINNGTVIEHTYWLNTQMDANRLGADLCTLGFDAGQWSAASRRPFSQELPRAIARLPGIRFRARKSSTPGKQGDKVFHNLHLNAVLSGKPLPQARPAKPAPETAPAGVQEEAIPF